MSFPFRHPIDMDSSADTTLRTVFKPFKSAGSLKPRQLNVLVVLVVPAQGIVIASIPLQFLRTILISSRSPRSYVCLSKVSFFK